jgi:hypothetical protein
MKQVTAIKQGYYGGRLLAPGDVFEVPDDAKASWFAPAAASAAKASAALIVPPEAKAEETKAGDAGKAEPIPAAYKPKQR